MSRDICPEARDNAAFGRRGMLEMRPEVPQFQPIGANMSGKTNTTTGNRPMPTSRELLMEALEGACLKAFDRIAAESQNGAVELRQSDEDTRVILFEGESIIDAAQGMDDDDIADLVMLVNGLR